MLSPVTIPAQLSHEPLVFVRKSPYSRILGLSRRGAMGESSVLNRMHMQQNARYPNSPYSFVAPPYQKTARAEADWSESLPSVRRAHE
jgi:hypothetical protein